MTLPPPYAVAKHVPVVLDEAVSLVASQHDYSSAVTTPPCLVAAILPIEFLVRNDTSGDDYTITSLSSLRQRSHTGFVVYLIFHVIVAPYFTIHGTAEYTTYLRSEGNDRH